MGEETNTFSTDRTALNMPKLWAIADIHLSFKSNRDEWAKLKHRQDDGLILAGDGML